MVQVGAGFLLPSPEEAYSPPTVRKDCLLGISKEPLHPSPIPTGSRKIGGETSGRMRRDRLPCFKLWVRGLGSSSVSGLVTLVMFYHFKATFYDFGKLFIFCNSHFCSRFHIRVWFLKPLLPSHQ